MTKRLLIILLSQCMVMNVSIAKKLYKYVDENGTPHFTDQKPGDEIVFESSNLEIDPASRIQLRQIGSKQKPVYQIINEYYAPAEILLTGKNLVNMMSKPSLPIHTIIEPNSTETIAKINLVNPLQAGQYNLQLVSVPGIPQLNPNINFLYQMPFEAKKKYLISQGFGGKYSHLDPSNYYAIDIAMLIGTNIYAAREGIVMAVDNNFFGSGTKRKYLARANHVTILHDDGTFAIYAHLDLASVRVHPGEKIKRGFHLGKSGNTGFSTGPHLHFAILYNAGLKLKSIPFKFIGKNKTGLVPIENEYISAP